MTAPRIHPEDRLLLTIKRLSFCRSTDEVIQVVRTSARDATGADGVTFVLREGENVFYAEENAIGPLWKGKRFPASACISGWAMLNRCPVTIDDIYEDPRVPHDAYRPTFVKSLAMMPVRAEDPVAAIGAYWAERHRTTEDEIATLQTIADATALALQNAELYANLQAALDRERQLNRAKDEWLSVISHELRTPLTPILGWIRLLQTRTFDEARFRSSLQIIERNLHTHFRIIQDLIDVSRMVTGKLEIERSPIDLRDCIKSAVEPFTVLADEKSIRLICDLPGTTLISNGDSSRLRQVLQNLLDNAIKFTPEHGTVSLTLIRTGNHAEIRVADTGAGISPDFLPSVFERFSQQDSSSKRRAGGLGLGLWIVKHIVELHGGTIDALSAGIGRGCVFTVRLPLAE